MEITRFIFEIIVGVAALAAIFISLSGRSQRRELHWGFEPASKQEFKEHVHHNTKRHAELFSGINEAKTQAAQELKGKADEISKEVNLLGRDMAALLATNDQQSKAIAIINHDIKTLLQRK